MAPKNYIALKSKCLYFKSKICVFQICNNGTKKVASRQAKIAPPSSSPFATYKKLRTWKASLTRVVYAESTKAARIHALAKSI